MCRREKVGEEEGSQKKISRREEDERRSSALDFLLQLPYDIAQLVFHRMNLAARLRVPAVCRSWRALSATFTPPTTPEQPWVIIRDSCCPTFRLVDFSTPVPSVHHMPSPRYEFGESKKFINNMAHIVAGSHGRFVILSQVVPHFNCIYDPFSGRTRALPQGCRPMDCTRLRISRAKLSCSPTAANIRAKRCVVAAITGNKTDREIYLCYPDCDYWTIILSPTEGGICDFAFHGGWLHAIDRNGIILVSSADLTSNSASVTQRLIWGLRFDVSMVICSQVVVDRTPCRDVRLQRDCYPREFLVESCGELLLVHQHPWPLGANIDFKVYSIVEAKVGSGDGRRKLVEVHDLGDRMLFLGNGCSISWSASAASASEFFIKNCIYFFAQYSNNVERFHLQPGIAEAEFSPKALDESTFDGHSYPHWNQLWLSP